MKKHLIVGPPGTGKTSDLINRVFAGLLEQGVPPQRIAYVSFTRKASEEARNRLRERFDLPASHFPYCRTLHSLAYRELGLVQGDLMKDNHWKELSDLTGVTFSGDNYNDGVGPSDMTAFHLYLAQSRCRSPREHYMEVAGTARARQYNFGGLHRGVSLDKFVRCGDYLATYKSRAGLYDFGDMLVHGCNVPPLDIDYAIIDEAQDLSRLQWKFCKNIFANCKEVFIAGDDDQAIYSWAGADLFTFRNMEADRKVLDHSWRLPVAVWELARAISESIVDRYDKNWAPKDEQGLFGIIGGLQDLELNNGESWYLLTRTKSQQQGLVHWLRGHGYTYLRNGRHSVRPEHLSLAKAWTRLLRGEYVTTEQAQNLFQYLRDDQKDPKLSQNIVLAEPGGRLRIQNLVDDYGLKVTRGVWHDVLTIDRADTHYYRAVKDRMGVHALIDEPKIRVDTIHAVKGGEADNVYFSNSMGSRPHRHFKQGYTTDDEARIFYVAATRAKKRLFVKPSVQCAFPLPLHNLQNVQQGSNI